MNKLLHFKISPSWTKIILLVASWENLQATTKEK